MGSAFDLKSAVSVGWGGCLQRWRSLATGKPSRRFSGPRGVKRPGNRIRALPGPEYREFVAPKAFWHVAIWQLSPQRNRAGYVLQGQSLTRTTDRELYCRTVLLRALCVGAPQRPTCANELMPGATGGYPRIACIIEGAGNNHLAQIPLGPRPILCMFAGRGSTRMSVALSGTTYGGFSMNIDLNAGCGEGCAGDSGN